MARILIVQRGPEIGKRYSLDNKVITVGRSDDNDIILDDPFMSRYHAVIKEQDESLAIIDLGSENPVQIRDTPLEPGDPYKLENRDIVRLGQNILIFVDTSQLPPRPVNTASPSQESPKAQPSAAPASSPAQAPAPQSSTQAAGQRVQPSVQPGQSQPAEVQDALAPGSFAPAQMASQPVKDNVLEQPQPVFSLPQNEALPKVQPSHFQAEKDEPTGKVEPPDDYNSEATVIDIRPNSSWKAGNAGQSQQSSYNSPQNVVPEPDADEERTVIGNYSPQGVRNPQPNPQAAQPPQSYNNYGQYGQYNQGHYGQNQPNQPQNQHQDQPAPNPAAEATQIASYGQYKPGQPAHQPPPPVEEDYDAGDAPTTIIRIDKTKL